MGELGDLDDPEQPSETTDAGVTTEDNGPTQVPDTTIEPATTAGNDQYRDPQQLPFLQFCFCHFITRHKSKVRPMELRPMDLDLCVFHGASTTMQHR